MFSMPAVQLINATSGSNAASCFLAYPSCLWLHGERAGDSICGAAVQDIWGNH